MENTIKFSIGTLLLSILLCFSCGEVAEEKVDESKEAEAAFVSNPVLVPEQEVKPLAIGAEAPDFRLPGVDGKYHSLSEYDDSKVLAVIFTCNHCPTAQAYEQRLKDIVKDYADKSVQVVAISPNSPLGLLYEELGYSDLGDSYEDMKIRHREAAFNFPYLYDGDDQKVSLQYGPAATPHCFVFDEARKLQYVGRIDASEKPGTAQGEDLRAGIDAILAGTTPELSTTKTFGCSTKWGWKTKMRTKIDKEWAEKEVNLEVITVNQLKEVIQNKGDKLRLINVWATWCGPCRLEYPEFVVLQRMFGARDFEFVSVAADKLSKQEETLAFLKNMQSANTNYIVSNDDRYSLIEAIDPEWAGAMPYTMLIEPGGNVVWRYQGEVDFQALKRIIVDHPMIGRVY
jgi:thiol-disulfide isomerase/thioredoxin